MMSLDFESDVKFHYPYIFYNYEKNEIWAQKLDRPNVILRYVFINTITAFDFTDDVYTGDTTTQNDSNEIRLLLTYENNHRIATLKISDTTGYMTRIEKSVSFGDLPHSKIVSFAFILARNENDKEEPTIMFLYRNKLIFYLLKSGIIRKELEWNYSKRNVIHFKDVIFFWEDYGRSIERIDLPVKKEEKEFFYKCYDAKNSLKVNLYFLKNNFV